MMHIELFKFYDEEVNCQTSSQPTQFTDYLCRSPSLTLLLQRQASREVRQWFSKPFRESCSLPRSQTGLQCSKNKIPPVKWSALRLSAFNTGANQKLERHSKHAHPDTTEDHAWNVGLLDVCAKADSWKSAENALKETQKEKVSTSFIFGWILRIKRKSRHCYVGFYTAVKT